MTPVIEIWISLGLTLGVGLGLGQFVPIKSLAGRVLIGGTLVHLIFLILNIKFGFALTTIFYFICVLGFLGCTIFLRNLVKGREWATLVNPALILPLLIVLIILIRPTPEYQMFEWDEFASWAYWTKELYLTDSLSGPDMLWRQLAYPQGWPVALIFPQLPFDEFKPQRSLSIGLIWYAATIGLVYEFVALHLRDMVRIDRRISGVIGYIIVFAMISVEAIYKFVPQNLLIEQPQVLLITAIFLLFFLRRA